MKTIWSDPFYEVELAQEKFRDTGILIKLSVLRACVDDTYSPAYNTYNILDWKFVLEETKNNIERLKIHYSTDYYEANDISLSLEYSLLDVDENKEAIRLWFILNKSNS